MTEKFDPSHLERPFDKECQKNNPHKAYQCTYVEAYHYIRRMNQATSYKWSLEVVTSEVINKIARGGSGTPHIVVLVRLTVPDLGIIKEQYGGTSLSGKDPEDAYKAAVADGMKKCMSLMGLGSELYGDEERPPESPPERRLQDMPTQEQWSEMYRLAGYPPESVDDPDVAREYKLRFMENINELAKKHFGLGWQKITRSQADKLIVILKEERDVQAG